MHDVCMRRILHETVTTLNLSDRVGLHEFVNRQHTTSTHDDDDDDDDDEVSLLTLHTEMKLQLAVDPRELHLPVR
jgi:hypothetical protein